MTIIVTGNEDVNLCILTEIQKIADYNGSKLTWKVKDVK